MIERQFRVTIVFEMSCLIGYDVIIVDSSRNLFVFVARSWSRIFTFINLVFRVFVDKIERNRVRVTVLQGKRGLQRW